MQRSYAEPTPKQSSVTQSRALPIKRNDEFMLLFQPEGWDFVEHAEVGRDGKRGKPVAKWVPRLSQVPIKRGANSINTHGSIAEYKGQMEQRGALVFTHGDRRLGPYKDFICTVPCEWKGRGGVYHLTPFERPTVLGGLTRIETDTHAYYDMLCYLVEKGVVEPMSRVVLLNLLEQQERRIRGLEDRAASAPHLVKRLDAARAKLTAMKAQYELQFGEPGESEAEVEEAAAPKRRGRSPKAKPEPALDYTGDE